MPHDHAHHGHHHHHHHVDPEAGDRQVAIAVGINMLLTVAQIIGGVFSGSIALIADAVHNFSDAISLMIAFFARKIARRPANAAMTFGYGRAEMVAAAKDAQREIAVQKRAVAEAQRDIAQRDEALAAETSAHADGIAAGERILTLLSDDVIDYDPSAKKWKPARNWASSGIAVAEMRETIRLLPKPMLRFISKTITVVKNILDRERTKIDREWEDVRNAAQTVVEARERMGLEEDSVIFDLTTNPSQRDGF